MMFLWLKRPFEESHMLSLLSTISLDFSNTCLSRYLFEYLLDLS